MRSPRTLFMAFTTVLALTMSPAFAADQPKSEQIDIQVDLDASPEDQIRSIRDQAWAACTPETKSNHAAARNAVRRACIKDVVRDVLNQLPISDRTELAETE